MKKVFLALFFLATQFSCLNAKVAVCYWGLTRSTKLVYQSHYDKLYRILEENNIDYDVFLHTWQINSKQRVRDKELNIPIDYEEYQLLKPKYFQRDEQDEFTKALNFSDYYYESVARLKGFKRKGEWIPELILNHICALESQKRVTNMVIESQNKYDYVIYVRPDVMLLNDFPIDPMLALKKGDILIPDFAHYEGYNDRFAVLTLQTAPLYGKRVDGLKEFRKHNGRIVSEKYVKYICDTNHLNVILIDFNFEIVRPQT